MRPKSITQAVQMLAALLTSTVTTKMPPARERDKQPLWLHKKRKADAAAKRNRRGLRRSDERHWRVEYHGKPVGFVGRHW